MHTDYRVVERNGCSLVFGTIPAMDFIGLSKRHGAEAVVDLHAARLAAASFVIGSFDDLQVLKPALETEARARVDQDPTFAKLSAAAREWLAVGEHGNSAMAIFYHTLGRRPPSLATGKETAHPIGVSDLRRCRLLVEAVPEVGMRLPSMATVSAAWARLCEVWEELCGTMDAEVPTWRRRGQTAPRTHAIIGSLVNGQSATRLPEETNAQRQL